VSAEDIASTCAARPYVLGGERCGAPAAVIYFIGCVHEHVKISPACALHVAENFDINECWECFTGPQSHACPVTHRLVGDPA
jgi:hypothetical protein